jgi:hypothetical protein
VLGGGRYDGLIETLVAIIRRRVGWAAGIERLAMLVGDRPDDRLENDIAAENPAREPMRRLQCAMASGEPPRAASQPNCCDRFSRGSALIRLLKIGRARSDLNGCSMVAITNIGW